MEIVHAVAQPAAEPGFCECLASQFGISPKRRQHQDRLVPMLGFSRRLF
jgi:hypothetical protein